MCGKLWCFDGGTADGHKPPSAVYAKNSAGETKEMRAPSACAGDCEDPDRTTWTADDVEDGDGAGATGAKPKEFPAEERNAAGEEAKMRKTSKRELLRIARRRQRNVLCDVMLSARQCETG
jgi:hypothetical protein